MKKVYYLATCNTCNRIMKEVGIDNTFEQQNIKKEPISPSQFDSLLSMVNGEAEQLLNKRALKYRELDLKNKKITTPDIKKLITTEYTFLKRPVFIIDNTIFIGNSKNTIAALKKRI